MPMRCIGRVQELRQARGKPVKVHRSAACTAAPPACPPVNGRAQALHQPLASKTVFGAHNQHASALHLPSRLQPQAQPQDDMPSVDDLLGQLDDLVIPDIDQDLRTFQEQAGALFLDASSPPVSFGNDDAAEDALMTGAVVVDRSDCARVRVAGPECRQFLHNMTTNTFLDLAAGQGCSTVVITPQARCLDLTTCYAQADSLMMVLSPQGAPPALEHLRKYILDDKAVMLQDVSARCSMFTLMGAEAASVLESLGITQLANQPLHSHALLNFKGSPVMVAVGSGLSMPGYTMIADDAVAGDLWLALVGSKGCIPMGSSGWERQRVLQGCPGAGSELTQERNPFEAGLLDTVCLDKGCFMGQVGERLHLEQATLTMPQETLAKVSNAGTVKQRLMGVLLDSTVAVGAEVVPAEEEGKVGVVTSCTEGEDGTGGFALAFVRAKHAVADGRVLVGGVRGLLVELEHARWGGGEEEEEEEEEEDDAEAVAREARLQEMQARLEAWQKQQAGG